MRSTLEFKPQAEGIVVTKHKPPAFLGTQFNAMFNELRADTVTLTGMTTSGCRRATFDGALMRNHVVVPLECVADGSQLGHGLELFDMGAEYADVVPVEDVVADLRARV